MQVKLHANATTTPKIRTHIQQSTLAVAALTAELGVSETTIRRWRGRESVADRPHAPKTPTTTPSPEAERLICALRSDLALSPSDVTEGRRRCSRDSEGRRGGKEGGGALRGGWGCI